ncbi:hypothetical protein Tco_0873228 [Tanacetum coccineum]
MNKITSSCEICSGPHDTQYCMENPEQSFVDYASSRTDKVGDARLSKFEADFKQQQSEMTKKIDTVLKTITDRMAGALPSDTVKNLKLNVNSTSPVLSARSCLIEDPQCSTQIYSSINTITICPKQPNKSHVDEPEEERRNEEGSTESINTIELEEGPKNRPQLEPKDPTATKKIGSNGNNEEKEVEWIEVEEPLDLIDTSEESVYESLIKEMPR